MEEITLIYVVEGTRVISRMLEAASCQQNLWEKRNEIYSISTAVIVGLSEFADGSGSFRDDKKFNKVCNTKLSKNLTFFLINYEADTIKLEYI
jgi:hypothetical protein